MCYFSGWVAAGGWSLQSEQNNMSGSRSLRRTHCQPTPPLPLQQLGSEPKRRARLLAAGVQTAIHQRCSSRQPLANFKPPRSVIRHIYGRGARGVAGGAGWGRFN